MNRTFVQLVALVLIAAPLAAQPSPAASAGFDQYIRTVESRLAQQHHSPAAFLAPVNLPDAANRLRRGEQLIENLTPATQLLDATLYHWRGTAFVPGARAGDFERLLRDFNAYPRVFAPQVVQARILADDGDHLQARMRVRQQHVLIVVLDTTYDITYGRLDPLRQFSLSRSTQVSEIDSPGTASERVLSPAESHGFLWRLDTYWTWEERDGGLYLQIESVSLARSIPAGLGWAVRPFVDSVPRESLEFTLTSARNALRK